MNPFWRVQALSEAEQRLLSAALEAHARSTVRKKGLNCSAGAVINSWCGSKDYAKAIASALLTLGEVHGPVVAAFQVLDGDVSVEDLLHCGLRVAGWGNAFVKGEPDGIWSAVDGILKAEFNDIWKVIWDVTETLHNAGVSIYPNPACYTAATALALGIPREVAAWIFVQGRLAEWTRLIVDHDCSL
jgi:citrate synthase